MMVNIKMGLNPPAPDGEGDGKGEESDGYGGIDQVSHGSCWGWVG
jgi:hypothetical protein